MRTDASWTVLRRCWHRLGLVFKPFYYLLEVAPTQAPDSLRTLPEGFELALFDAHDIELISKHPQRVGYVRAGYVLQKFADGDGCLGVKHRGEIAAFTWFSLAHNHSPHYPVAMKGDEAYLYDMYVFDRYRGHNLAPVLRYKTYELLEGLGRHKFYSVTERSNAASLRFKQKLGARIVFLGLFVAVSGKYTARLVLRRYL